MSAPSGDIITARFVVAPPGQTLQTSALAVKGTLTSHVSNTVAAAAGASITLAQLSGGVVTAASAGAGTELAFDTAAHIVAAAGSASGMAPAVGDSWDFYVVNTDVADPGVNTLLLRAGVGGTLYGDFTLSSRAAVVGPPTAAGGSCKRCRLVLTNVTASTEAYTVYVA